MLVKLVDTKSLDKVMIDLLVEQMLNPNNKDFYIGNLTIEQVKELFVEMQQDCIDITTVFWTALSVAQATLIAEQEYEEQLIKEYEEICILEDMACEYAKHGNNSYYGDFKYVKLDPVCPNCGCTITQGYRDGVPCPNCG